MQKISMNSVLLGIVLATLVFSSVGCIIRERDHYYHDHYYHDDYYYRP